MRWPRPRAEALRAHRPLPDQALPRTAAAGHRVELAEPPSPRHRVRGRAAGRRAPARQARRHARAAAKVAARGAEARHTAPADVANRAAAPAAAAADRSRPDPLRAPAKARDGRLLEAPLRKAPVAPPQSTGDRPALHRRPTYRSAWEAFASDAPNMGERPGVCSHFVVAKNGRIHRLVRPGIRCRHTIGLNHRAIGVEMVQEGGRSSHWADRQILHRDRQIHALCTWSAGSSSASGSG